MKIVQFIHALTSGGAETLVKDYSIAMARHGHDVIVIVLNSDPELPNESAVRAAGVAIVPLLEDGDDNRPSHFFLKAFHSINLHVRICSRLSFFLADSKPDVLHFHLPLAKYVAATRKNLQGIKLFYTCHSEPSAYFENRGLDGRIDALSLGCLVKHAGLHLIALHGEMASDLSKRFNTDVKVVRNPVDVGRFARCNETRELYRESLGIDCDAFVIGHVGRFSDVKNHTWLVEVFSLVAKLDNRSFLLMIGDGEAKADVMEDLCRRGLENRFLILSNRSDVPNLLAMMDVFCFPSKWEGYPISVLEAQAAGIRCVVSDRVTTDIFITEGNSRVPLENNAELWAKAILNEGVCVFEPNPKNTMENYCLYNVINTIEYLYEEG